jgi:hypothetical protein
MSVNEAYYQFSLLLNKNSERRNIEIGRDNFVVLYNRESERWLSEFIEKNMRSDNIFKISELLIHDYKLQKISTTNDHIHYILPDDFFSILAGNSYSNVSKGSCTGVIYNYFKKPNDFNIQIEDKFLKPSFEWERGLGEVFNHGIVIYTGDFTIQDTFIAYFKTPPKIDMEGYIHIDGTPSKNKNPELSDYLVGQIIDRVVVEATREFSDQLGFQLAETRKQITI